ERVEPEQVRQGLRLGEIADGADRDVLAGVEEAEEVAADPSESVDADPRHGLLSKPRPRFARPRLRRGVLSPPTALSTTAARGREETEDEPSDRAARGGPAVPARVDFRA